MRIFKVTVRDKNSDQIFDVYTVVAENAHDAEGGGAVEFLREYIGEDFDPYDFYISDVAYQGTIDVLVTEDSVDTEESDQESEEPDYDFVDEVNGDGSKLRERDFNPTDYLRTPPLREAVLLATERVNSIGEDFVALCDDDSFNGLGPDALAANLLLANSLVQAKQALVILREATRG